jgi:hypothetical protein
MHWQDIEGVGRVAPNEFSPRELEIATGLTADLQRVWRRRGHLPARAASRASFDAYEVAAIAVRYELARRGIAPSETFPVGREAAPVVLYSALLSGHGAAELRGGFQRLAAVANEFSDNDRIAVLIAGTNAERRYLWTADPPAFSFVADIMSVIHEERFPGMIVIDLTVIGIELVAKAPKPLFLIDVADRIMSAPRSALIGD